MNKQNIIEVPIWSVAEAISSGWREKRVLLEMGIWAEA